MKFDKQTATVVGVSTAIGFLGDVLTYSVGQNQGKVFPLKMPKGKALVTVLLLGIVGGFVIDLAVKKFERSLMSPAERELTDLTDAEKEKIRKGQRDNQVPIQVLWKPSVKTA